MQKRVLHSGQKERPHMKLRYLTRVHLTAVRFSVPKCVSDQLDLAGGDWIYLSIHHPRTKRQLYQGDLQMRSGLEIYGPDLRRDLKKGQYIMVEASRSKRREPHTSRSLR